MPRPGTAVQHNPARLAPLVGCLLALLLPLNSLGVAFLPAWMPAHYHCSETTHAAFAAAALGTGATPHTAAEALLAPRLVEADAWRNHESHAGVQEQTQARDAALPASRDERGARHRHHHANMVAHESMSHQADRTLSSHQYAANGVHSHSAPAATAAEPLPQPAVNPANPSLARATAPHEHATIVRHHHGGDTLNAGTMVLVSQPASDHADALLARAGWDPPWPLLPAGVSVAARATAPWLRRHIQAPHPPPTLASLLRPPRRPV